MIPCQAKQSRLTKWIGPVNHYNGGARDLNVGPYRSLMSTPARSERFMPIW